MIPFKKPLLRQRKQAKTTNWKAFLTTLITMLALLRNLKFNMRPSKAWAMWEIRIITKTIRPRSSVTQIKLKPTWTFAIWIRRLGPCWKHWYFIYSKMRTTIAWKNSMNFLFDKILISTFESFLGNFLNFILFS